MWCSRQTLCFWKCFITFLIFLSCTRSLLNHQSSLRASMMRRNNLGLLEKNCATKNVIWENVDSIGACFGHTALSKPWQARQVESTLFWQLANFEEVSLNTVWFAQFFQGYSSSSSSSIIIIIISSSSYHITILAKFTTYSAERKREQKILPSLNILDSWSFNLNVFPFQVLAWMNCH